MKLELFSLLCLGVFVTAPLPVMAAAVPSSADQMLAAVRAASGGAHWNKVTAIVSQGTVREDGMNCSERGIVDLRNGRWREETHCSAFSEADGIDAHGPWHQDRSGQVHSLDSPEATTLAITDRWLNRRGPLFPHRSPTALTTLAPATASGVTYARIGATPAKGRTVTLWIDHKTHHIARTVMRRSFQKVTVRYDDYRSVDGLQLPFRITTEVGKPAQITTETITHYKLLSHLPTQALNRPSDAVTDVQLPGGHTEVPILPSVEGQLLIKARIDGKGPFPFALDTGGQATLTPATAKRLGLKTMGKTAIVGAGAGATQGTFARVHSIQLGGAKITNQSFMVVPITPILSDRGEKPPVAGLLGLEIFERFAVTIDMTHRQLKLQSFDRAKPPPRATALSIYFTANVPLVYAKLDGKRGIFQVDTGNPFSLTLFPDWAKQNGLARYYLAGVPEMRGGMGGAYMTHAAYIRSLKLGGLELHDELIGVLAPPGTGGFSNPDEAGNLSMPVWRNFRITFNYRKGRMYLTRRPHYEPKRASASAGFTAIKLMHDAFIVFRVDPTSAAAKAGMKRGDRIIAVNGIAAKNLASFYLVTYIEHAKPGTKINLTLAGGHQVMIVLTSSAAREKALHPKVQ